MPFSVNGEVDIQTSLTIQSQLSNGTWVDSMKFTDNVISTQVTDGDIQIAPNGSGNVYLGLLNNNEQITVGSTLNLYDNVIADPGGGLDRLQTETRGAIGDAYGAYQDKQKTQQMDPNRRLSRPMSQGYKQNVNQLQGLMSRSTQ